MNSNPTTITRSQAITLAAVILFALAIVFPAASTARSSGKYALCFANLHLLTQAWLAYPEDNDGRLVGGSTRYYAERPGWDLNKYGNMTPWRWVERPLYGPTDNPARAPDGFGSIVPSDYDINHEYRLNGIKAGELYPYIENTAVYHCPNDRHWIEQAEPHAVYRSYSISGLMNGSDFYERTGWPGKITGYSSMTLPGGLPITLTLIDAEKPSQIVMPSAKYVFLEEDVVYDSVARDLETDHEGSFVYRWDADPPLWLMPTAMHAGYCPFSFADGHVDIHRWEYPPLVLPGGNPDRNLQFAEFQNWMWSGYLAAQ